MSLGSAFQKVNFLRDLNSDYQLLDRTYFRTLIYLILMKKVKPP